MIKELTQFIQSVPKLVRERALEPKAGIHILISFDEYGNSSIVDSERFLGKKHGLISTFLQDCAVRQEAAWMIDTNKCFDLPMKGIHSASPYCLAFKRESWIGGDKYPSDGSKSNILERLESYFSKTLDAKYGLDASSIERTNQFKLLLKNELESLLENIEGYADLDWGEYIVIYQKVPLEKYLTFQEKYLSDGLFNTTEYNIDHNGTILGTSNFYNGFNSKKPFLTHQTASFDITSRISTSEAKALTDFQIFAGKKLFPNPLPIFISKPDLTEDAILIYHRTEDKKSSHREIISELWKMKKELGNYYLLYFTGGTILDFDFVSKFDYLLNNEIDTDSKTINWVIENVLEIKNKNKELQPSVTLSSVFDFEVLVISQLFNNSLVKVDDKKGEISMRYFDNLDSKYYRPTYYNLMLKYRKPIYDFIYKSMRNGLGHHQFKDICISGILDDLKESKEYSIKIKLNIYFSLIQHFNKNKNNIYMPSKIEEHKTEIALMLENSDLHLKSDEVYAFGTGQLIYYLLSQSEAGERTHALLEPFLQKTNHAHFNEAISNLLLKYKHAISFNFERFNKLVSEVLDYTPTLSLQDLRPIILAGYFCPNILYSKKSNS